MLRKWKRVNVDEKGQNLSGDFQHECGKMHTEILLGVQWYAMCIFLFLRFYDFFKGFAHIYIFIKKLGPLLLYLTYELAQIFMNVNRTEVLLFKQVNK